MGAFLGCGVGVVLGRVCLRGKDRLYPQKMGVESEKWGFILTPFLIPQIHFSI